MRWENKFDPTDFGVAYDKNVKKLKVRSPLYYGELLNVIGDRCGGQLFQWLKLFLSGDKTVAKPISIVYDLSSLRGGALFLHNIIWMQCLLQKLQNKPTFTPPMRLYKAILRSDDAGRVTCYPKLINKEVVPALNKGKLEELQSLYDAIEGLRYLIQLHSRIQILCNTTMLTFHLGNYASDLLKTM